MLVTPGHMAEGHLPKGNKSHKLGHESDSNPQRDLQHSTVTIAPSEYLCLLRMTNCCYLRCNMYFPDEKYTDVECAHHTMVSILWKIMNINTDPSNQMRATFIYKTKFWLHKNWSYKNVYVHARACACVCVEQIINVIEVFKFCA